MQNMRAEESNRIALGLIKAGVEKSVAEKIADRYFDNELTIEDLNNLKKELIEKTDTTIKNSEEKINIKIEALKENLKLELKSTEDRLNNNINNVKRDINDVETRLNGEIKLVKKDINIINENVEALDKKIDDNTKTLDKKIEDGFLRLEKAISERLNWKTQILLGSLGLGVFALFKILDKFI